MFPALPRYDECERGMVEHACRVVVYRSRKEYLYPANHWASSTAATQTNVPAMGQRLRLKSSFAIPSIWNTEEKAILLGLKKYGALVADNGNFFSISITPDDRWPANAFSHISTVGITNFEVVQSTGLNEGPRSPGAPTASAGPNRSVPFGSPVQLQGFVSYTNASPTIQWKLYSGPGNVNFSNAAQTNTTATFSAPGVYTLMLSAVDGVHAVAYAASVISVTQALTVAIAPSGTNLNLSWSGGSPPYVVERADLLPAQLWIPVATNNNLSIVLPVIGRTGYLRVRSK
jgi:hypothetical protein